MKESINLYNIIDSFCSFIYCLYKINLYKLLSHFPFYKIKALNKVKKYEELLEQNLKLYFLSEKFSINNLSQMMATNLDIIRAKANIINRDSGKKFILIIGSLKYASYLSLYSNSILKSLEYKNIVVHFFDILSGKLIRVDNETYEQNEDYKEVLYSSSIENIDASMYDISIQIIDANFELVTPLKPAKIAYAYIIPVDNEKIYENVSNTVNISFDAVLYPIKGMDDVLYKNEVLLPKFYIPFSIDLNLYERFNFYPNEDKVKICFIGNIKDLELYFRPLLVINNFLIKNNIDIEFIYFEANPNFQRECIKDEECIVKKLEKLQTSNIKLKKGFLYLLPPEIYEINKKFDLIVYTENVENYMYNPIQSVTCGKCAVFPNTYKISGLISNVEGCYKYAMNNKIDNIISIIKDFVNNKKKIYSKNSVSKRKDIGKIYSLENNKIFYNQLLFPQDLILGHNNEILKSGLQFKEQNLYVKYNYYEKRKEYNIKGGLTPVPIHDAGFGSVLNKYVSLLVYSKEKEIDLPD